MTVVLDAESQAFPRQLLGWCSSALLAFCSGRMGAADGHWIREAGLLDVTCVDWDEKTLIPFADEYPVDWRYFQADAFEWVEGCGRSFDIVSADLPSQYADRMLESVPLWTGVAERFVTMTVMGSCLGERWAPPSGWRVHGLLPRASYPDGRDYFWLVLERS